MSSYVLSRRSLLPAAAACAMNGDASGTVEKAIHQPLRFFAPRGDIGLRVHCGAPDDHVATLRNIRLEALL